MRISRAATLVWNFIIPVILVALIAAIIIVTLRVDSKFAKEAVTSRRAACVAVADGNATTYNYLNALYGTDPSATTFLSGLKDAYDGNLTSCLIKANTAPK